MLNELRTLPESTGAVNVNDIPDDLGTFMAPLVGEVERTLNGTVVNENVYGVPSMLPLCEPIAGASVTDYVVELFSCTSGAIVNEFAPSNALNAAGTGGTMVNAELSPVVSIGAFIVTVITAVIS